MVMHYKEQSTKHMETITVYKLFRQEADGLHPLFIDREQRLPIGVWLTAWAPTITDDTEVGYHLFSMSDEMLYGDKEPFASSVTRIPNDTIKYAIRRGWRPIEIRKGKRKRLIYDIGIGSDGQVLRFAHRPGWHTSAEPRLPSVDMTGKVWAECLIPADDYYIHRVNVSGLTRDNEPLEWYISQKIFIVRLVDSPQTNHVESTTRGT